MAEELIILGAGTMAQEITDLVEDIGSYKVIGYAIDTRFLKENKLNKLPILFASELPNFLNKGIKVVRGIFSPLCFNFIKEVEKMGFEFATIIHPSSSISKTVDISKGVVINRLVSIGCFSKIEKHVLINRGCSIGHHCCISEGVTLGPAVNIAGSVFIGENSMIGMGANIIQNAKIRENSKVRAGSLIVR